MTQQKTIFTPVDPGPDISQTDKLRILTSYHVHKPITRVTHEDITATAEMVRGRRTVIIEEKFAPKTITRDEIIQTCLDEWAAQFARTYPKGEKPPIENPNVSEEDRKLEARLLGVKYVEPPKPTARPVRPGKMETGESSNEDGM